MYAIFVGKEKGQQKNDMAFLHQCISEILVEAGLCPAVFEEARAVFVNIKKHNIEKGYALGFSDVDDCRRAACWLREHLRRGLHNLPGKELPELKPFTDNITGKDLKDATKLWYSANKDRKIRAFIFRGKGSFRIIGHQANN